MLSMAYILLAHERTSHNISIGRDFRDPLTTHITDEEAEAQPTEATYQSSRESKSMSSGFLLLDAISQASHTLLWPVCFSVIGDKSTCTSCSC